MKLNRYTLRKLIMESLKNVKVPNESLTAFYNKEDLTNLSNWIAGGEDLLVPSIDSLLASNLPFYLGTFNAGQINNGKYVQHFLPVYEISIRTESKHASPMDLKNLIVEWSTNYNQRHPKAEINLIFPQKSDGLDYYDDLEDKSKVVRIGEYKTGNELPNTYINFLIVPDMRGAYLR